MALPASGQISSSDIRSELQLNISDFSFALAAGSSYVRLNSQSPSLPPSNPTINLKMSDWYSYCHTCSVPCGNYHYYLNGGKEYIIVDLGTQSGKFTYSGFTGDLPYRFYLGYPYNSSGTLVGTPIITDDGVNTNFNAQYNFLYTGERYLYYLPGTKFAGLSVTCPNINLYWSFSQGADSGSFEITVNSNQVVYETNTNSGNISVNYGDTIGVNVVSNMGFGYTFADATTSIVEDGSTVCSDSQSSNPTAYSSCSRTVAGFDLQVYGTAAQV